MQLISIDPQASRRRYRISLRRVANVAWLAIISAFYCMSSQAQAYEFTVTNTDSKAIEVVTAYGTDLSGRPFVHFEQRFINGPFVLQPGETKLHFTFRHTMEAAW